MLAELLRNVAEQDGVAATVHRHDRQGLRTFDERGGTWGFGGAWVLSIQMTSAKHRRQLQVSFDFVDVGVGRLLRRGLGGEDGDGGFVSVVEWGLGVGQRGR